MALLFIDGFDHYQTSDILKKYTSSSGGAILPTSGRRGGGCLSNSSISARTVKGISSTNIIMGAAISIVANFDEYFGIFGLTNTLGNPVSTLRYSNNKFIIENTGNSAIGVSTPVPTWGVGVWNYVEWKMQIADSIPANSCIVRVNGVEVLNLPAGTDTRYGTEGTTISSVQLGTWSAISGGRYSATMYVDDFYICDTVGASPTDFLGDIRVDTLLPTADGTYNDGVPSTGTDSWSILDTVPPVYTQYVSLTNTGEKESLQFANLSPITSQTIYGIQVDLDSSKSDSGTKIVAPLALSNAVLGEAANTALTTGYRFATGILTTDPNTSTAWDESGVNAAEFGIVIK
jgi:hypothetical protein